MLLKLWKPSSLKLLQSYKYVCKALYGEGPYILSPLYRQFIKGYKEWREMSKQEKRNHLEYFFNFIPSEADLNSCGIKLLEKKPG